MAHKGQGLLEAGYEAAWGHSRDYCITDATHKLFPHHELRDDEKKTPTPQIGWNPYARSN